MGKVMQHQEKGEAVATSMGDMLTCMAAWHKGDHSRSGGHDTQETSGCTMFVSGSMLSGCYAGAV